MIADGQTDTAESHQLCAARNRSRFGLDWGLGWAVWAVALATALLLVSPVLNATMRFGLDYSEGWNAIHAARLMAGEPLYPAFDALIGNNYPPLSFYAAGWLGYGLGDYLLAGRLLAFVGLLTSAAAAAAIVKLLTGRIKAALLAGLLLLGYNAAVNAVYVGLDDPQWLGHGIMVLGLLAFLASEQRGLLLLFSAALMLAAGFVKHLLFPIPLAATLWLLLYRRAVVAYWLTACSALAVSALLVCFVAYGGDFFQGVFHDVRSWSWRSAISAGAIRLESALPLVLLGAFALPSTWRIAAGRVIVFYAAVSAVSAVYVSGGAGVDINAIFDLDIALCLMIGVAIAELERGQASVGAGMMPGFKRPTCWALLILLVLGVHVPLRLQAARNFWHGGKRSRDAAEVIGLLSNTPGPVACEDLSLCYRAGKGFELDFFLLGQKLSAGSIAPRVLASRLQAHYYAAIQTVANDGSSFRLPAYINTVIAEHYQIARTGPEGAVLVPRGTPN